MCLRWTSCSYRRPLLSTSLCTGCCVQAVVVHCCCVQAVVVRRIIITRVVTSLPPPPLHRVFLVSSVHSSCCACCLPCTHTGARVSAHDTRTYGCCTPALQRNPHTHHPMLRAGAAAHQVTGLARALCASCATAAGTFAGFGAVEVVLWTLAPVPHLFRTQVQKLHCILWDHDDLMADDKIGTYAGCRQHALMSTPTNPVVHPLFLPRHTAVTASQGDTLAHRPA